MIRNFRKPLIIISPKILLRHANATSSLADMKPGTSFKPVIGNDNINTSKINKVILTSGKHYYALEDYRKTIRESNVAIIRLECLCPFPLQELLEEIQKYNNAKLFIWSQEEPRNMGAWNFVKSRFENLCGRQLKYCGRPTMAASADGESKLHKREAEEVIKTPFLIKNILN